MLKSKILYLLITVCFVSCTILFTPAPLADRSNDAPIDNTGGVSVDDNSGGGTSGGGTSGGGTSGGGTSGGGTSGGGTSGGNTGGTSGGGTSGGGTPGDVPKDSDSLHYDIVNDMFKASEGMPAGVPNSYDWKHKPRVNLGLKIPSDWNAVYAWGQVYADENEPNPDQDFPLARVQIKDLQLYIYRSDGTWDLIQDVESPIGDSYVEDFEGNKNKPASIKKEADGGISIQAGSGYNFHFYPKSQKQLDNFDIKGVFVICKARLIGTETYSELPKYLLNVGGDYWRNTSVGWEPNYKNNDDIAIGRFKYVTMEWRSFTMHTFKPVGEADKIVFPVE